MKLPRYVMLEKAVGETPLRCMEDWRAEHDVPTDIPLTYAGRLDPMASGKLLVLIGDECKKKEAYLGLDKTYEFSVLFGIGSDTHDVLGRLQTDTFLQPGTPPLGALRAAKPSLTPQEGARALETQLCEICTNLTGDIELPYPHFSSKTVDGKPLFQWSLENRLHEIDIPTRKSTIYSLTLDKIETKSRAKVCAEARAKIDTMPEVTNPKKALGEDFRRTEVRADWERIKSNCWTSDVQQFDLSDSYHIAHFTCTASSGTYMRMLAKLIGEQLNPPALSLAWSIHRKEINGISCAI